MRVKDFEEAIMAMNCNLTIDEFKLRNNQVRRCYAHKEGLIVMWDELGRGFTDDSHEHVTADTHDGMPERLYERDVDFDLKF